MGRVLGALALALLMSAPPALAQQSREQTLADVRQELSVLFVEIGRLKRELSTTGAPGGVTGTSVLDRIDVIEGELQRLTAKTEELEFQIGRIVADGTNRIGDLEFRLCELETGCDISDLGETSTLGGGEAPISPAPAPTPAPDQGGGAELALGEQADFERASSALEANDFGAAVSLLDAFIQSYPGGPLTAQAHYLRGEALLGLGRTTDAARAYLEAFSSAPQADTAPASLLALGQTLRDLGQMNEACVTLNEVQVRFPDSGAAFDAGAVRRAIGCT